MRTFDRVDSNGASETAIDTYVLACDVGSAKGKRMTAPASIRFLRLSFTGTNKSVASIDFGPGLSVLYGGSNAGKSFVLKAIDFVTGSRDAFPGTKQSQDYENVFLSFSLLPQRRTVTIRRAIRGGDIDWYEGAANEAEIDGVEPETLHHIHGKGRKANVMAIFEMLLSRSMPAGPD